MITFAKAYNKDPSFAENFAYSILNSICFTLLFINFVVTD